ncbi:MAG: diphosphate--fructose-6-phosphate 1-phosphotransferase, partial [Planctomycetota bacterium]
MRGNAVVGQAGGPTVVINQSLVGIIQEVQKYGHIEKLYGARHGVRGIINEQFYDLKRQPENMLELVAQTPAAALGATRDKPGEEYCARVLEVLKKHNIRYFFYIGGNDSAQSAQIINNIANDEKYDLRTIHVPKTIDNDLLATDHCPGYGSAARFVAMAFIGDDLDNRALQGVKNNILMGRNAGFLTAASILARQRGDDVPHLVYLPERPFDIDQFVNDVEEVHDRIGRCLVAISEGIADADGTLWAEKVSMLRQEELGKDEFGHIQLGVGAGALADFLAGNLRNRCKNISRVRADTYGYLQRSFPGCYSQVDA